MMSPMNSNNAKRSRGRPKGSTSFVKVRLGDLNKQLGNDAPVSVSKKWLIDIGLITDEPTAQIAPVEESKTEDKIQFTIK